MKLESSFQRFLRDVVNLNATRYEVARSSIDVMKDILQKDEVFGEKFIDAYPQGSFRQETIIKPVDSTIGFDVDLFFEMEYVEDWEPRDYLSKLADQFRKMDRYKDKVDTRGKSRCVTIDYESDFHVDIVPSVSANGVSYIMNKTANLFESTDGEGYAIWFEGQNTITQQKYLTKVVRLMKHLRDSKGEFEVKSILLTTLLGNEVLPDDDLEQHYPDLSTAFLTLIVRLDAYLQENQSVPTVTNPALPEEDFNRHWDQKKYSLFRAYIHDYAQKSQEAYFSDDKSESLEKWQEIFGDDFVLSPEPSDISSATMRDSEEEFLSDYGISENLQYAIRINSKVKQKGWREKLIRTFSGPLSKDGRLEWYIERNDVPPPYSVRWKVKNTGAEARAAGKLRGQILNDAGNESRVENTMYWGNHYIECYVIKGGICVGKDRYEVRVDQS